MKRIEFKEIKEEVFYEKLENGLEVYLYPTNKSKNFYATISTKYGSSVMSYKKGNKTINVLPGTAHFLEHKVMNFTTNKEYMERVNKLGSITNAYTTYNVTNYNIFGSKNIIENLSLIFDMVYNPVITNENVKNEKGIISEEIDMDKDDINISSMLKKLKNLFYKSFPINHILGEKEDINKMTSSYLKMIYNDFYRPNNMFVIVVGNFNKEEVIGYIRTYMKKFQSKNKETIKIKKVKEPDEVKVAYEEISKNTFETKVYYSIKINKNIFKDINKTDINYYLNIILSANFSTTSRLYEKYKNKKIVSTLAAGFKIYDNHIIISIVASTDDKDKFINNIKRDINNLSLTENVFDRKRKKLLSEVILGFENIEDIEFLVTYNILENKKLDNKDYQIIENLDYKKCLSVMKKLKFDNNSILVCKK